MSAGAREALRLARLALEVAERLDRPGPCPAAVALRLREIETGARRLREEVVD